MEFRLITIDLPNPTSWNQPEHAVRVFREATKERTGICVYSQNGELYGVFSIAKDSKEQKSLELHFPRTKGFDIVVISEAAAIVAGLVG
jgi:hypothetical protein